MSDHKAAISQAPVLRPRPWHLWVVGILSLIWNGFGAFDYSATQFQWQAYMSNFTESQLEYFYGLPAWQVSAWAFGVWGALLGSIGLILAKRWAVLMFAVSLVGMLASFATYFWSEQAQEAMGQSGWIFSAVIVVVGVVLLRYSRNMSKKGVLR